MVNWKQIYKNCLGICSCFSGRKRKEKKKTEEIGLKKLSHANESQIPLVEEEISEISGENNDNSQTLNVKIESSKVNELTNVSNTKKKNNAQEWLDKNYPKEERENVIELSISYKELEGSLDLKDFVNLELLDCSNNQLTALDLVNCQKLKYFSCSSNKLVVLDLTNLSQLEIFSCGDNYLTNLDYSFLSDKIIFLDVFNNDLPQQNLNCLSYLVSLEYLIIGNNDERKINSSIYNRWTGSLKFLKNLRSLRWLVISNTDIDSGTEHLPDSIKIINCSSGERPDSQVKAIAEKLNNSQSFILDEKKNTYVSAKKETFQNAQEWLDCRYPFPNRKNIKWLDISYRNLTGSLKLEGFTNLKDLICLSNNLTSLEVKSCPKLELINCDENQLTKLELSQCPHLKELSCSSNQLADLEVSHYQELTFLNCSDNQLVDLNCNNLRQLTELYCHQNQLTGLDLRKNNKLVKLTCFNKEFSLSCDDIEKFREEYKSFLEEVNNGSKLSVEVIKQIKDFKHSFDSYVDYNEVVEKTSNPREELTQEEEKLIDKLIFNQKLRERYKKYGLCRECNQPNTGNDYGSSWCRPCNSKHFQAEFKNWTSGNPKVDQFIRRYQLEAINSDGILEWIPYENLTNIEYLAEGGFGKVYKAKWTDGWIDYWNSKDGKWRRHNRRGFGKDVVLKFLNNSRNISTEFLQETYCHRLFSNIDFVLECYGISQDPHTGNYVMVINYVHDGSLKKYLVDNYSKLSFEDKLQKLRYIAMGLNSIHQRGLIHRDFHPGNILNVSKVVCVIADLGLCRPVDAKSDSEVFGVMPYVAPEVLQGKPYTKASDIYSFGIVAYEVLSGLPHCYNEEHNINLALAICKGERPKFKIKVPQMLMDLISRCWDTDPLQRPSASELQEILTNWYCEIILSNNDEFKEVYIEFAQQVEVTEKINKTLPDEIRYPTYQSPENWHSKPINTQQITELLQNSPEINTMIENFDSLLINPQELELELQAQQEIPPKK